MYIHGVWFRDNWLHFFLYLFFYHLHSWSMMTCCCYDYDCDHGCDCDCDYGCDVDDTSWFFWETNSNRWLGFEILRNRNWVSSELAIQVDDFLTISHSWVWIEMSINEDCRMKVKTRWWYQHSLDHRAQQEDGFNFQFENCAISLFKTKKKSSQSQENYFNTLNFAVQTLRYCISSISQFTSVLQ